MTTTTTPAPDSDQRQQLILQANAAAARGDHAGALRLLRQLPLQTFGELLLDIPEFHPALRAWLPSMASDKVQRSWTGSSGRALLAQSIDFVTAIDRACQRWLGHGIQGCVLDYGCGWGRLLRLLPWYIDPHQLYGIDAWGPSLELCRQHGCLGHIMRCDEIPQGLPCNGPFDLVYAFSVFTHLSARTADAVLNALHPRVAADGLLVITIRPPGYWDVHQGWREGYTRASLLQCHHREGFAFMPHYREPVSGELTYGDTSMTLEYIERQWPQWRILGTDHNPSDPWQILVFLQPG